MTPALPARRADCPPAIELERLSAGEASPAAAHLPTCPSCAAYVAALQGQAEVFLRARPADRFLQQVQARSQARPARRGVLRWVAVAAVAAAGVVFGVWPAPSTDGVAFKGSLLSVTVKHGEKTAPVGPTDALHPEDALRFTILAPHDGFAAVLEKDSKGEVTVVAPFNAQRPSAVHAGANTLPDSAVLDATTGKTKYVAVYGPAPFDLRLLVEQLYVAETVDCRDCTVEVSSFDKRP